MNADLAPLVARYRELVREELLRRPWLDGDLRGAVEAVALDLIRRDRLPLAPGELERLTAAVADEAAGVGPLEALVRDPTVTEVIVNGPDRVYAEREGRLREEAVRFEDEAHLRHVIDRIVSAVGRRVDESSPMVDARLPDGSRVNAVLPPLAVDGPLLTIRKFSAAALSIATMVDTGSVRPVHAELLERAVRGRLNVVISGGTGTGKTTLLNALAAYIDPAERIVTVEDAAELRLPQPHVARLEARPSNIEGRGEITIRALVRNALRMRPDRIVVGEVRGGEALDMLQAMNTGHDGSLTTVHASSPEDALRRIETMALMGGVDLPHAAIREQLQSAVDLVVHVARQRDGHRAVRYVEGRRRATGELRPLDARLLDELIDGRCGPIA
ncbi:MAG TPA: CpaF family protein [Gaiellales bacterium]|jgi:pilus assembly protein CpaF|nr:CpaF family protein [Gaiellales bacterium]